MRPRHENHRAPPLTQKAIERRCAHVPLSLSLLVPSGRSCRSNGLGFRWAKGRSAPVRLAPFRKALRRYAWVRFMPLRLQPTRSVDRITDAPFGPGRADALEKVAVDTRISQTPGRQPLRAGMHPVPPRVRA